MSGVAFDFAVVGGGASGALLVARLLRVPRPVQIAWIERRREHGRGAAYGTDDPAHLLNVPARGMSALPEEPGHFVAWLERAHPGAFTSASFVERRIYARYLADVVCGAEARAAPGSSLERMREDVASAEIVGGIVELGTRSGRRIAAREVALAIGNAPPAELRGASPELVASPRYVRDPWGPAALEGLDGDQALLLVGAGLTAVDVLLSRARRGDAGVTHLVSTHGLLPHVHREHAPAPAPAPGADLRTIVRSLRARAREHVAAGGDWRAVVDSLRPHAQSLWRGFSPADRKRFVRHLRTHWDIHRHRLAPEVAAVVESLRAANRLRLRAGRVRSLRLAGDAVEVEIRPRGARASEHLRVARVVNCTGPTSDWARLEDGLLRSLLASGLARLDPLGLGLDATAEGRMIGRSGAPEIGLWTIGPTMRGALWETTAIPEIRAQAAKLAAAMAGG